MARVEQKEAATGDYRKDFNLCRSTELDHQVAAIDTQACFWLMLYRNGKVTQLDIQRVLAQMEPKRAEIYRERLNELKPRFKAIKSLKPHYTEQQWGKLRQMFDKTTAQQG